MTAAPRPGTSSRWSSEPRLELSPTWYSKSSQLDLKGVDKDLGTHMFPPLSLVRMSLVEISKFNFMHICWSVRSIRGVASTQKALAMELPDFRRRPSQKLSAALLIWPKRRTPPQLVQLRAEGQRVFSPPQWFMRGRLFATLCCTGGEALHEPAGDCS